MSKASTLHVARGPEVLLMLNGQTLPVGCGLDLQLVYVEDSIPLFKTKPRGSRPELWTASEDHPGYYYRCCRWPSRKKQPNFDKLINKACTTRAVMDAALNMLKSGSLCLEGGRA